MKKLTLLFSAVLLTSLTLTSCGGASMESDAQRVAEITCKVSGIMEKVMDGDEDAKAESEKLAEEMESLKEEMEEKYTTDEEQKKFQEAVMEASKDCE